MLFFFRMKNQHFQVFKDNEEARRIAVEAALSELLARDTQYRKELKAHLETRLENAEARRNMLISIIRKVSDVAKDVLRDIFFSERPIGLKLVSADTEYSARFRRIFGRISTLKLGQNRSNFLK